ncbi:MAG: hypothetical protein Q8M74_03745, partial [Chloroflexota bacterium]|nr:hypothetical protein [Chloroflexota bacterium]
GGKAMSSVRGGAAALLALGASAALVVAGIAQADQPVPGWRAGEPMEVEVAVPRAVLDVARERATGAFRAFDIPAFTVETQRVANRFDALVLDHSTTLDARGRALGTIDEDTATGRIRSIVNLADLGGSMAGTASSMPGKARALLARLAIEAPSSDPTVVWDQGMGAWAVLWPRTIDGVPAPQDAVAVWVLSNGGLRAILDHETAVSRPGAVIPQDQAVARARAFMDDNPTAQQAVFTSVATEWQQANNFVNPAAPDAPTGALRLVYAVSYSIDLANGLGSSGILWVDAESGEIIGGSDVN